MWKNDIRPREAGRQHPAIFGEDDDRATGDDDRTRGCCVCVMTVTAPHYHDDEGPQGISYDHSATSASLGTGDQTNRLPIARPIIGTIDTTRGNARFSHRRRTDAETIRQERKRSHRRGRERKELSHRRFPPVPTVFFRLLAFELPALHSASLCSSLNWFHGGSRGSERNCMLKTNSWKRKSANKFRLRTQQQLESQSKVNIILTGVHWDHVCERVAVSVTCAFFIHANREF